MKTFLKIFAFLLVLIAVVGLFLDNKVNVSRQIEVNAAPEMIHAYVADLNQWPKWSPWLELDPTIQTTIGNVSSGVGASQSWVGQSGSGALTIVQSHESDGIVYHLTFDGDSTVYVAGLRYASQGDSTLVSWYMTGEMKPIIIGNYFAQLMDGFIGKDFENGLAKLKQVVESEGYDSQQ
jgi:uncharacterized membrane protein